MVMVLIKLSCSYPKKLIFGEVISLINNNAHTFLAIKLNQQTEPILMKLKDTIISYCINRLIITNPSYHADFSFMILVFWDCFGEKMGVTAKGSDISTPNKMLVDHMSQRLSRNHVIEIFRAD